MNPADEGLLVAFDLDGTLVDSTSEITSAINLALASRGFEDFSDAQIKPLIGLAPQDIFRHLGLTADLHQATIDFRTELARTGGARCQLLPHVRRTLETLGTLQIRIAVATNKPSDLARQVLNRFALSERIEIVVGSEGLEPKPKPDILHKCLNVARASTGLMVGDSSVDVEAGRSAGYKTVAVATGSHSLEQLRAMKPDYAIPNLGTLIDEVVNPEMARLRLAASPEQGQAKP